MALIVASGLLLLATYSNVAAGSFSEACKANPSSSICKQNNNDLTLTAKRVIEIMMIAVGALSVIMIIFGGLKYVLSAGDSRAVDSAKSTILYAVIGLIVALLAFAIVNFVVKII